MGLAMTVAFACLLLALCLSQAGLGQASADTSVKPTHSFDSYDLYQVGMAVEEQSAAGLEKKDMKTKSPVAMEEYAVCKTGAGACAATRLSCSAACMQKFYHYGYGHHGGYGGGGYGHGGGYGGGGYGHGGEYGREYGGGGYRRGYGGRGYGRGYGGGGFGRGYGGRGGGYGGGGGSGGGYGGGSGGGGGGGWASACKYDCASACKATC